MRRWIWAAVGLLFVLSLAIGCTPSTGKAAGASGAGSPEGILVVAPRSVKRGMAAPTRGVEAPDFVFVAEDGTEYHLRDFRGRPVVLNFWATWCPPCRAEMPALDAAYTAGKDHGLLILAVNQMEDREQVRKFREVMGLHLPMVLDLQGVVGRAYLVRGLPTSFFVDENGVVALRWTGMLTEEALQQGLEAITPAGE